MVRRLDGSAVIRRLDRIEFRAVACPKCGAEAGAYCQTRNGCSRQKHGPRKDVAKQASCGGLLDLHDGRMARGEVEETVTPRAAPWL